MAGTDSPRFKARLEGIIDDYKSVLELNENDHETLYLKARDLFQLAKDYNLELNHRLWDEILTCYSKAICAAKEEEVSDEALYLAKRSVIYSELGKFDEAGADLMRCANIDTSKLEEFDRHHFRHVIADLQKLEQISRIFVEAKEAGTLTAKEADALIQLTKIAESNTAKLGVHDKQFVEQKQTNRTLFEGQQLNADEIKWIKEKLAKVSEDVEQRKVCNDEVQELMRKLEESKADRGELQASAFKPKQEILDNPSLKEHFNAMLLELCSRQAEAMLICGGARFKIDTSTAVTQGVSAAASLIPYVGKAIAAGPQLKVKNDITKEAMSFYKGLNSSPVGGLSILIEVAEQCTLKKKEEINGSTEYHPEIQVWNQNDCFRKPKDFITENVEKEIFKSPAQKLGCIAALKVDKCLESLDGLELDKSQIIQQLVDATVEYKFTAADYFVHVDKKPKNPNKSKFYVND